MAPFSESGGKRESPNFHGTGEGATNGVELRKASQNVRKSGRSCGGSLIDLNKCSGHDDTTLLFKRVRTVDVTTSFNERYRVWKILHTRVAQLMQVITHHRVLRRVCGPPTMSCNPMLETCRAPPFPPSDCKKILADHPPYPAFLEPISRYALRRRIQ
jgi:hypothetical protein